MLTFQLPDGSYRASVLLLISHYSGQCSYDFAISTYTGRQKPTLSDVINGDALGGQYLPLNHTGRIGFEVIEIGHKHLRAIASLFERIGTIPINPETRCISSMGGSVDFKSFASWFDDFYSFLGAKKTRVTHPKLIFAIQQLLLSKSGT